MSEFVDSGDPEIGKEYNKIEEVDCPRCGKQMDKVSVIRDTHWWPWLLPTQTLEMGWCVMCHRDNGASQDCLTCHY